MSRTGRLRQGPRCEAMPITRMGLRRSTASGITFRFACSIRNEHKAKEIEGIISKKRSNIIRYLLKVFPIIYIMQRVLVGSHQLWPISTSMEEEN